MTWSLHAHTRLETKPAILRSTRAPATQIWATGNLRQYFADIKRAYAVTILSDRRITGQIPDLTSVRIT